MWILDAVASRERFPEADQALGTYAKVTNANLPRLILRYEQTNEAEKILIGVAGSIHAALSVTWLGAKISWNMPSIYLSSRGTTLAQDVKFFGELELAKRKEELLAPLGVLEPRLQQLTLALLGDQTVIHGDIGLPRLVPVPFMGEGVARLLSILLAIANAPKGVVLVDEIENGLHYSVMKDVWKAIAQAARQADVQVFATTHSWECIRSAHEAFHEATTYDLRLFRLDRIHDQTEAVCYTPEMLETALATGLEMR